MVIFRYLSREIIGAVLATTVVLLIIFISNQFVHYLNDAAQGKITTEAVFEIMSIQVPLLLGFLLPLSWYIALLLTVGRLCTDHELIALYSCGFSRGQLLRQVAILAVFLAAVVAFLMLYVESRMQFERSRILQKAVASASLNKILPGRFQQLGSNTAKVFYAQYLQKSNEQMRDVFFAQKKASETYKGETSWDVVSADAAYEKVNPQDGNFLIFKQGYRYVGVPGELKYKKIHFDEYGVRLAQTKTEINKRVALMPTTQLWQMQRTNFYAAAELQWRLAMPISVLILTLIAMPMSEVNPRSGKFARLMPAILIYIVYANLMLMSRAWIQKGVIAPVLGIWWVHALFLVVGLGMTWWRFKKR